MILIADSGSSKTSWRGIDANGGIHQWEGPGINPLHLSDASIARLLNETFPEKQHADRVFFYGAGCVDGEPSARMSIQLAEFFKAEAIEIADDMLAVARGVCGREEGIACILGTGANSCYYNGTVITAKEPALGFILGDEGSGSWLGKQLLNAYFHRDLPQDLSDRLEKRFDLARASVLEAVYQQARPAAYLAGFSKFIFQHRDNPFLSQMIYQGFILFLEKNVCKYADHLTVPVHFSGSVAFYYSTLLRKACADRGIAVKNIVEGPIAGLTLYHRNTEL